MTTTQAQDEFDFQTAFLQASTERTVALTVGADANKKTLTIRRWSLTQQMQLGHSMALILNQVATQLARHIKLDEQKDGKVSVSISMAEIVSNTMVFSKVMADCAEHIFRVITATIAPNFDSLEKAQEFAETLEVADAIQIIMLIVRHNAMTDEAKKKFSDLVSVIPKTQPSRSPE